MSDTHSSTSLSCKTHTKQARVWGQGPHSSPAASATPGRRSGSPAAGTGCTKSMTSSGSEGLEVLPSRDCGEWQCTPLSQRTCSSKSSSRESIVSSKNRMTSFSSCVRYFRLSSSYIIGLGVGKGRDKTKSSFTEEKKTRTKSG